MAIKIIGYCPLHYGKTYLGASLRSIEPFIDSFVVLYTPKGSQGHRTDLINPDTKEELRSIAVDILGSKLIWSEKEYTYEGEHRDHVFSFAKGEDILFALDADEILEPNDMENTIKTVYDGVFRSYGCNGFINFWKSFNWEVKDFFRPVRATNLNNSLSAGQGEILQRIYHFSCVQDEATIRYKWQLSGHKNELEKGWIEKYLTWTPEKIDEITHLHPASRDIWIKPEPFNKFNLPEFMHSHKNFNVENIL